MGIYSQNRLSFAGCDLEFDPRPGSRFSGLSGFMEYVDLLSEQMTIYDHIDRILEDGEEGGEEKKEDPQLPAVINKPEDESKKSKEEDQKKKIDIKEKLAKIGEFFQKIIEAIGKLIDAIKDKLMEFINIDDKLVEKYSGVLKNTDALKGFEGVAGVKLTPEMLDMKKIDEIASEIDENISKPFEKAVETINNSNADDKDSFKPIEDEFSKACTDYINKLKGIGEKKEESSEEKAEDKEQEAEKTGTVSDDKYIPDQETLNKISDNLSKSKELLDSLEKARSSAQKTLREKRRNGSGKDSTEADLAIYRLNITLGKNTAQAYSIVLKGMLESYRVQRKVWITCGKFASLKSGKKGSEEKASESVEYHFALDEFIAESEQKALENFTDIDGFDAYMNSLEEAFDIDSILADILCEDNLVRNVEIINRDALHEIADKIADLIENIISAIGRLIIEIIPKYLEKSKTFKKSVEKYQPYLKDINNLDGIAHDHFLSLKYVDSIYERFQDILNKFNTNKRMPYFFGDILSDDYEESKVDIYEKFVEYSERLRDEGFEEDKYVLKQLVDQFKELINKGEGHNREINFNLFHSSSAPTKGELDKCAEILTNSQQMFAKLNEACKKFKGELANQKKEIKKQTNMKLNSGKAYYQLVSIFLTAQRRILTSFISNTLTMYGQIFSFYKDCGEYAMNKVKGKESSNNETVSSESCKNEEATSDKQDQPEEEKFTGEDVNESVDDQPTQEEESNLSGIEDLEDETVPAIGDEISNEIEETNEQTQYHYTLETMFQ